MDKVVHGAQAGQGGGVLIAVVNKAKTPLRYDLKSLVSALQVFLLQHFVPVWGYGAALYITDAPKSRDWQLVFLDDADEAGALGYHDLTINGQPLSKVFVHTTQQAGEDVAVTAGHELCEMLIDPIANLWADHTDGYQYAYEMCDAVEEDTFLVNSIPMSNFVHPAWFESFKHPAGTRFDHLAKLTQPFTMTKGGYLIRRDLQTGDVKNVFGSSAKEARFAKEDRRGHRSEHRRPDGQLIVPNGIV